MNELTSEDEKLLNHWVQFSSDSEGEIHVFIDEEGLVSDDFELLHRLGYELTNKVMNARESGSNLIHNFYEGESTERLRDYFGFTESRLMTDVEIYEAVSRMPDAIAAYAEQDLKNACKINGIEHLYKVIVE